MVNKHDISIEENEDKSMANNQLVHTIIRVPKEESAFVYFTLEANEGLSFYSTLQESLGEGFRDIAIKTHECFEKELDHLIETLGLEIPIEIRLREKIDDK
ncbi:MAG: hypothetical protein ACJAT2_000970 [Bacteriovoracaceae bacterium]